MTPGEAARLVLLRHGESEWNAQNLYTGWANPGLTAHGQWQAAGAGEHVGTLGQPPDLVHTSLQRRTIRTTEIALATCDRDWIPVRRSWRLNGRHYGALQGRSKADVLAEHGEEQVRAWRRSYSVAPPPAPHARHFQHADPRYGSLPPEARPCTESLQDVTARLLPYWYDAIVPDLRAGACVLVVSHGNTLRALVKHLDAISDQEVGALEIPNGVPLLYFLDHDMRPLTPGERYLSQKEVRRASTGDQDDEPVLAPPAGSVRYVTKG